MVSIRQGSRAASPKRLSCNGKGNVPTTSGKEATLNSRRLQLIGVGMTAAADAFDMLHAERLAAEVKYFGKKSANPTTVAHPNAR